MVTKYLRKPKFERCSPNGPFQAELFEYTLAEIVPEWPEYFKLESRIEYLRTYIPNHINSCQPCHTLQEHYANALRAYGRETIITIRNHLTANPASTMALSNDDRTGSILTQS